MLLQCSKFVFKIFLQKMFILNALIFKYTSFSSADKWKDYKVMAFAFLI